MERGSSILATLEMADFRAFAERDDVRGRAFTERIVDARYSVEGGIAHAWVEFEAEVQGAGRGTMRGLDSIQLIRAGERWSIVAITNEVLGRKAGSEGGPARES